ncbi:pyridoxal-phosphate dependent enzyme [Nocardia abscessus]|uniref:pyridoxal-phosphate dependent enzyme n=1 Tax=Nocardia abscessus TaxID=120957 RepID=UPI002456D2C1|nr:pyridoxal-phosphate dependent enzyme [Nocardia abscessus]
MSQQLARISLSDARTDSPLRSLKIHWQHTWCRLRLKLEMYNPTGSVKYRTAVGLLSSLDATAPIGEGTRVIESTSGNLGVALSAILSGMGAQFIAVVDPKLSPEMRSTMTGTGAQLISVDAQDNRGGYLQSRLALVQQLRDRDADLRWTDQYNNPANPTVHREISAAELLEQSRRRIDAVFIAVSTGGTLAGISEGLRRALPDVDVFAVDVFGSIVTSDIGRSHLLTGIGSSRKSAFLRPGHHDHSVRVNDFEAFAYCRLLAADTGLALGGSSGAVLAGFVRALRSGAGCEFPVAIMADGGDRYLSTLYDDAWLDSRGALNDVIRAEKDARDQGARFELEP